MEHKDYRIILEQVLKHTNQRHLITRCEVATYTGQSRQAVARKYFKKRREPMPVESFARMLCEGR